MKKKKKEQNKFIGLVMPISMVRVLEEMALEDDLDTSKFIRHLIRKEYNRRADNMTNAMRTGTTKE